MGTIARLTVMVGLGWTCAAAHGQESFAETRAEILEAWLKHKSLSAQIEMEVFRTESGEGELRSDITGIYLMERAGDGMKYRVEMREDARMRLADGREERALSQLLIVSDGEIEWKVVEVGQQRQAVKGRTDPNMGADMRAVLDELGRDYEVKVLPDEEVGGVLCHVLEGSRKPEAEKRPYDVWTLRIGKQDGVVRRQALRANDGGWRQLLQFKNLEIDPSIPPERFQYTPPPTMEVRDLTQQSTTQPR